MATMQKNTRRNKPRLPAQGIIYDTKCPVLYTLGIIGGKWKLPILWQLAAHGTVRYNEFRRLVQGITNMMLTKCLRELETNGLVFRKHYDAIPPRVEYSLTSRSEDLLALLRKLYPWGEEQIRYEEKRNAATRT